MGRTQERPAPLSPHPVWKWSAAVIIRLVIGLGLCCVCWALSWSGHHLSNLVFSPLWVGYILTVDGLALARHGASLTTRLGLSGVLALSLFSSAFWVIFELLNFPLGDWSYVGAFPFGWQATVLGTALAFATVLPAIFATAILYINPVPDRIDPTALDRPAGVSVYSLDWALQTPSRRMTLTLLAAGALAFALLYRFPREAFALLWAAPGLILDPLAARLGRPSLLVLLRRGNRVPLSRLGLAALTCGFFWEMWNWHASPKWVYHVPYVGGAKIFEMPAAGYLGYLGFGCIAFASYQLACGLFLRRSPRPDGLTALLLHRGPGAE